MKGSGAGGGHHYRSYRGQRGRGVVMRLTVLGGSAASPNAGMGCAGFLVESDTTRVVLDFGPGVLPELRRHTDFCTLNGIVISHMHVDHTLDLLALRHALAYNPIPAPGPVAVWLPPGGEAQLAAAAAPFDAHDEPGRFASTVRVREYNPATGLTIGNLRLQFAPTQHFIPGFAIRITDRAGRALGYTGDTGPTVGLASFFTGVDLLIAEATLLDPPPPVTATRGSLSAREAGELATVADAARLLLTHIWEEHGAERQTAAAETTYAGPIDVAVPGFLVSL